MNDNIPYYIINEPYELFYKNGITINPVGAHTHNTAEIYLTLTPLPDVLLNDTVSSVQKGTLILIPPFCVHQLYHEENIEFERYILNIDVHWLEAVLQTKQELTECLSQSNNPLILPLDDELLLNLTEAMNSYLPLANSKSIKNTAAFFTMLSVLDSAVSNARKNNSLTQIKVTKSQKTVNDIIAYINENLEKNIALSDISKQFYLNKDYLARVFAKHTHTTIGRYMSMQRITKAQEYLRSGFSVTEVSDIMGFSSYSYFFKVFQKMTGVSPSQYKKNLPIR